MSAVSPAQVDVDVTINLPQDVFEKLVNRLVEAAKKQNAASAEKESSHAEDSEQKQ